MEGAGRLSHELKNLFFYEKVLHQTSASGQGRSFALQGTVGLGTIGDSKGRTGGKLGVVL